MLYHQRLISLFFCSSWGLLLNMFIRCLQRRFSLPVLPEGTIFIQPTTENLFLIRRKMKNLSHGFHLQLGTDLSLNRVRFKRPWTISECMARLAWSNLGNSKESQGRSQQKAKAQQYTRELGRQVDLGNKFHVRTF